MSEWEKSKAWNERSRAYPVPTQSVGVSADLTALHPAETEVDYSSNPLRWIYVGGDGDLYIKKSEDSAFHKYVVTAGQYIAGLIVAVSTSTTATELVGER